MKKDKPTDIFWIIGIVFVIGGIIAKQFVEEKYIGDIFFIAGTISIAVAILLILSKNDSLINWLVKDSIRFYLPIFGVALVSLLFLNHFYGITFKDILTESNGVMLDLLIFGILWISYERVKTRKEKIESIMLEIDSFRYDQNEGNGRRLKQLILEYNKLGNSSLNLNDCILSNLVFERINLKGSELIGTDLSNTTFHDSDLSNCKIGAGSYNYLEIYDSILVSTYFNGMNSDVSFYDCDLSRTKFEECNFDNISMKNSKIGNSENWMNGLKSTQSRNRNLTKFLRSHEIVEVENKINKN